ncbi:MULTISPECIES: GPR1/FUN34/YaaH family transporter [unclassified Blastococcus]
MSPDGATGAAGTRIVLRPLATPLPLGFLALALATTMFSAVQLGWIPAAEGRVAGCTALFATFPLQLLASVFGFLSRDPVAATGMGILSGTWAVAGFTTLTSPPGSVSSGLGVLLLVAGLGMFTPAAVAMGSKVVPAAVMALAGTRFVVTGVYEMTGSQAWKTGAGWIGVALAVLALYAALALELEGAQEKTVLPLGRRGPGRTVMAGEGPLAPEELIEEAGVRPQL